MRFAEDGKRRSAGGLKFLREFRGTEVFAYQALAWARLLEFGDDAGALSAKGGGEVERRGHRVRKAHQPVERHPLLADGGVFAAQGRKLFKYVAHLTASIMASSFAAALPESIDSAARARALL